MRWRRFFAGVEKPAAPPTQLEDGTQKFFLADFASFHAHEPTVLFFRPRRQLSDDELHNVGDFIARFKWPRSVSVVLIPHEMDVLAIGEAQLKKLGWAKMEGLSDG